MKKEKPIDNIHIGSIIKAKASERNISDTQLAQMIHCHYSTIHDIYGRKGINTEQLWKIAEALEYNFFTDIYGNSFNSVIQNDQNLGITTVVISTEKVSIEQRNGITKITEYQKIHEN